MIEPTAMAHDQRAWFKACNEILGAAPEMNMTDQIGAVFGTGEDLNLAEK